MACQLYAHAPELQTGEGRRILTARGGSRCAGGYVETPVTLRIRHHRRLRRDRTLAETSGWQDVSGVDLEVAYNCPLSKRITVFTEALYPRFRRKRKSNYISVACGY
jgi:hypothetical protein